MTFTWPWMLAALLLVPVGIWLAMDIERQRRRRLAKLGSLGLGSGSERRLRRWRDVVPSAILVAAVVVLVLALARPQAVISVPRLEGTVILALDVSGSMAADDVEPSRLDAAKAIARQIVEARPDGVVIGLSAFSDGGLSLEVPTGDETVLLEAIDRLEPTLGTSLGDGILASLDAIAKVSQGTPLEYYSSLEPEPTTPPPPVEPGSHGAAAVVLLSDGDNTTPPEPEAIADTAADLGIRIHVVGIGSPEGATLELDGFAVHTRLDEDRLRYVADVTAGSFQGLDPELGAVEDALDPEAIFSSLGRQLTLRDEQLEVTSLLAGAGVLLLVAGTVISLAMRGRVA